MRTIEELRDAVIKAEAIKTNISQSVEARKCAIKKLQRALKNTQEALLIMQTVAQKTQQELEYKVSEIVSLALSSVFDDPYEFKITFEIKREKTEAVISFLKNGNEFNPMNETGGGVVDVAAFALRIALWSLAQPKTRNVIILDEPFRFVSESLRDRASLMLQTISHKMQIQFIIITHMPELLEHADKVFTVENKNGKSYVSEEM